MCLLALPGYSMRIKATAMVGLRPQQKIDFHPSMSELEPPLKLILNTCQEILVNRSLQNFMAVVLQLGNVLNSVHDVYWIITALSIHKNFILFCRIVTPVMLSDSN